MIYNYFINCDLCETGINLRSQIGYFDIPFNLHCPTCKTHIHGKLVIDQENIETKLELENAHSKSNKIDSKEITIPQNYPRNFLQRRWIYVA